MSKGAVIIACDTDEIKYTELAAVSAKFIKKNLDLPVALITNSTDVPDVFNAVINIMDVKNNRRTTSMYGINQTLDWYNLNRTDVYDLTPWDRTLLVDADFFALTDNLKNHMQANFDFAIADMIHDPFTGTSKKDNITANRPITQSWATVMIFNKSKLAKSIFSLSKHIIKHYSTYAKIYDFESKPIRNDFAFSIACHLLGGYGLTNFGLKNYNLTTVGFHSSIYKVKENNRFVVSNTAHDKINLQELALTDIHFLNKLDLIKHLDAIQ